MDQWLQILDRLDSWHVACSEPARLLKAAAAGCYTDADIGYYWQPEQQIGGIFGEQAEPDELVRTKYAAMQATGSSVLFLSYQQLGEEPWVKVAYSPTLRHLGEYLNFFPGQYAPGIPNHPNPMTAMLTTGLLGAGLGYGLGRVGQAILPAGVGKKLPRTGMILGGMLGATPGVVWGAVNRGMGKPILDNSLLSAPPDSPPVNAVPKYTPFPTLAQLEETPISPNIKAACTRFCKEAYGETMADLPPGVADVNIDALGRTLWNASVTPATAGTTMGTVYAAQQLPSPRARPGWATGDQLGQLAMNAAGDYGRGLVAGMALNALIGTPLNASTYGLINAAAGLIVPRMFG